MPRLEPTPISMQTPLGTLAVPEAFLLDFDGVIVDSAELKTAAFAEIYADEAPDTLAGIVAYQRHHGGVSRRVKFAHFEQMLGRDPTEARLDDLCRRFSDAVVAKVIAAPLMPGALSFLAAARRVCDLFLISGTPAAELRHIVDARGLSGFFRATHGAPETKAAAFASILASQGYDPRRTVAVGDAVTECDAALGLGIPFVGITPPSHDAGFPPDVAQVDRLLDLAAMFGIATEGV